MKTLVSTSKISGRGVFAAKNIRKGELIEVAPVILFSKSQQYQIDATALGDYYFEWSKDDFALALGHGSLYNHATDSNADYEIDIASQAIRFKALRSIKKGQEIFVNYNGEHGDTTPLWFEISELETA